MELLKSKPKNELKSELKNELDIKMMIGKSYVNDEFESENSEFVGKCYKEIARINKALFDQIPYKVIFTDDDSYSSAKEMRERVIKENVIYIYKGGNDHVFLTGKENLQGRAVHDVFAHMVCGCPFSFKGEYNAYLEQRKFYPEWTWKVLYAEIPAQTSAFYYTGGFNFKQRSIEASDIWLEECKQLECDYSKNSVMKPFNSLYFENSNFENAKLKTLDELDCLNQKISIFIPTEFVESINEIMLEMAEMFGGCTKINGCGAWKNENGKLIQESITIIYSNCKMIDNLQIDQVLNLAENVRDECGQDCVGLELNNKMYFI